MLDAEPLIATYSLDKWMNPMYNTDRDNDRKCHPAVLASRYRGVYRLIRQQGSDEDLILSNDADDDETE